MLINTTGIMAGPWLKRLEIPTSPKKAKDTSLKPESAERSNSVSGILVTPIGIPITVVAIIPMSRAPFTLISIRTIIITRPITDRRGPAALK
jgi:hypothetical protein